jgi:hypothetical protein
LTQQWKDDARAFAARAFAARAFAARSLAEVDYE